MSNLNYPRLGFVILAAGDGKRMKSVTPKVMTLLRGRPLIDYVVSAAAAAAAATGLPPIVVVSTKHILVQTYLGDRARYVIQAEQLGTGHAVATAESTLRGQADAIVVLYGDMPCLEAGSIRRLIMAHNESGGVLTMMTATTPDFTDWRAAFRTFGRVVRGWNGTVARIVESKDATSEELLIRELSTCYFCFQSEWLWEHLQKLQNTNAQGEYYLGDLVAMAIAEGHEIVTVPVDLREVAGVNSQEDLAFVQTMNIEESGIRNHE